MWCTKISVVLVKTNCGYFMNKKFKDNFKVIDWAKLIDNSVKENQMGNFQRIDSQINIALFNKNTAYLFLFSIFSHARVFLTSVQSNFLHVFQMRTYNWLRRKRLLTIFKLGFGCNSCKSEKKN